MRLGRRSSMQRNVFRGRRARGFALAVSTAGLAIVVSAPSAGAAVTIGQLGTPPGATCDVLVDRVQPTVTSGASYVLPSTGGVQDWTITSWSSSPPATPATTAWKMKIFRQVTGATFTAVAQDGPRNLTGGVLNTFQTNVRAKPGDILGVNVIANATPCSFVQPGDSYLRTVGLGSDLANGASAAFGTTVANRRLNITAVATPTNTFELSKGKRNTKKGIGRLEVEDILNPGKLVVSGKGVKRVTETVNAGASEILKVAAKGNKRQRLNSSGKTTVKPKVTFTPTSGEAGTESKKVKLKKD